MDYLAVHWDAADDAARASADEAIRRIETFAGWSVAGRSPGLAILVPPQLRAKVRPWGRSGFILGEIYRAADGAVPARLPEGEDGGDLRPFRRLLHDHFGRYVAISGGPDAGVLRDPSGGIDALGWQVGRLNVLASDFRCAPPALRPPRLRLDWYAIARAMAAASASAAEPAFDGVSGLAPGAHRRLADPQTETLIWSPAHFARDRSETSDTTLADQLRDRVEVAVKALVGSRERIAVEVSGGLDSAIVALSLARLGPTDRVTAWLNYYSDRPEGDERPWAGGVTDAIGVDLTPIRLEVRPLVEADFAAVAAQARPPMNALLPHLDREVTRRLSRAGAVALLSGQGGDAALYQMPTALVLADEVARGGPAALSPPVLAAFAHSLRRSVWRVAAEALRPREPPNQSPRAVAALPKSLARQAHPWVRDAASLGPAKRLQIAGLANAHVAAGARRLTATADLLYPLFAQPVVELCLGIPAAALQRNGRDRALARRAFADRLPTAILERRKKGELTAFHAQTVAASLDYLRPHLLEGCLVAAGVIERRRLEAALRPDHLLRYAGGGEILVAAALEAWVRHWQRYVPDGEQTGREPFARSLAR